jgi:3-oxoacyl-[acyl-carrier-protein] synthase III
MKFASIEAVLPGRKLGNDQVLQMIKEANKGSMSVPELFATVSSIKKFFTIAGTETRFVREKGEDAASLIERAGVLALRGASLDRNDIDLLIYVGIGRGFLEPSTANVFQDRLRLTNATCFDLLDACASWVRAVHVAKAFISGGFYKNVMILSGEFIYNENIGKHLRFDSIQDLEHKFAIFTIGEAATATILSETDLDDEYHASFKTYGNLRNLCMIPFPNVAEYNVSESDHNLTPFQFYSYSRRLLAEGTEKSIEHFYSDSKINSYNYDITFGHAASDFSVDEVNKRCNGDKRALFKIHSRFGNTISSSVPLAMATALKEKRLKNEDRVLIGMASAGLSTGWTRFRFLTDWSERAD